MEWRPARRALRRLVRAMPRFPPLLLAGFAFALPVAAQDDDAVERDQDARLDELERRNQELEARLAEIEAVDALEEEDFGTGLELIYGDVHATFQIFSDVGAAYSNPEPADRGHTSFAFGSVDFFINANFGDHFRVLSETVIDGRTDDDIDLSQERLWGAWIPEDWFYAKLGVEHSPISRWNRLYHHGAWLQTTIARPLLVSFEGGQGILPLHRTGLEVGGNWFTDGGRWDYFATVSNGRGEQPTDKQRTEDIDDHKAIDVGLGFAPFGESDWHFGVAFVCDTIPEDPASADPLRARTMREWIATANVDWTNGPFRALSEWAFIAHEARANGREFDSNAGYLQLEYRIDELTPYTRIDYRKMDQGDPFYAELDRDLDAWLLTGGVRWDLHPNMALKFALGYGRNETRRSSGSIDTRSLVACALQLAWYL